ncbi:hypothetical protein DNTS_008657 [Danionella cerebrum]|uniref:Uncharacterized protein n=1 Tax=Danionella cerebrum TaxID=2873325 RepID=A0A553MKF2_9TELE|nr:hypothetical protein DNTS_008657 [Danionella translucida]
MDVLSSKRQMAKCKGLTDVVLLNSKESQAELGWTTYPSNGVRTSPSFFCCFSTDPGLT